MSAKILDGRACSQLIKDRVAAAIKKRTQKNFPPPGLDVILVGNDPASKSYVAHKERACQEVGIISQIHHLPQDVTQQSLIQLITECNNNPNTHGILLQLPLPDHIDAADLLERIDPKKDVDGFHPYNLGRLMQRRPALRPCTPYGVMLLLEQTGRDLTGTNAVVIGASNIVGRPMTMELLLAKCTVTVCHRFTKNLETHVRNADLLIVAIGKHGIIKSEWIKPETIVIDVGFNRLNNGKILGDIEFGTAKQRASWITPVPGGVGPMTVAVLMQNTLQAAENF